MFDLYTQDKNYPKDFWATDNEVLTSYKRIAVSLGLENKKPVKNPKSIIIGGQPGSGKSTLFTYAENFFNDNNVVKLDNDIWRDEHPRFELIKSYGKLDCDPILDFIKKLRTKFVNELTEKKYNLLIHTTMSGGGEICKWLKKQEDLGYETEVFALSCSKFESRLGVFDRFVRDVTTDGTIKRLATNTYQDDIYNNIPKAISLIENEGNADSIKVYNRERKLLFDNTTPGKYNYKSTVEALEKTRILPWSQEKLKSYKSKCALITDGITAIYQDGIINERDYAKIIKELSDLALNVDRIHQKPEQRNK